MVVGVITFKNFLQIGSEKILHKFSKYAIILTVIIDVNVLFLVFENFLQSARNIFKNFEKISSAD